MNESHAAAVPWRRSLLTKAMAGIVLGLLCLIGIVLLVFYWRGYELLTDRERAQASSAALRLGGELGQHLALAEGLATALANLGEVLPPDASLWQRSLPHVLDLEQRDSLIAGGGLWPEPGAFAPEVERASFFWGRDGNGQLQFYDDYNATDGPGYHREEWYVPARFQQPGRCYWSRSYQDPYTAEPMVTCSVPMIGAQGGFTGVSTVDLRLSGLQKFVAERGRSLRGYAMMVDRNGTFITLPGATEHGQAARLGESLSIATLAREMGSLAPMAAFLERAAEVAGPADEALARRISEAADQIPLDEARRVVAQLQASETDATEVSQTVFDRDPFLGEPVLVTALRLGGTHWQLVVVQPRRLVHEAVESVLTPVAIYLVLAIGLVALVAAWLVRRILVDPIRQMAEQVRQAELAPDTASHIAVPGNDELGQLAQAFNLRAERLAQSHARLQASAEQFRSVTALAHDALIQVDEQGVIRTVNPAGERMFGVSELQLQGLPLQQLLPWSPAADGDGHGDVSGGRSRAATRMRLLNATRPGGSSFPAEVSASYWQGPDGGLYNVQVRDITERRRAEEQVKLLATHDTLTGLPNRVLFQDRLQQAIKQCQRNRRPLGLLFLDLDNFKLANDSLGHAIGDSLLRAVSERLLACVSNEGSVARLGGDEFAILLPTLVEAGEAGEMASRVIAALEPGFSIDGHFLQIGVSIGVILCPNDGTDPDQLLRKADLAMYHAKAQGRNTYRFFTERLRTELLERTALLTDLKQAALGEQFMLHYQPIVATRSGEVHAVEALLRWRHPQRGLINPDTFIPLAERTGLIVPIGQWVIDRALAELAELDGELPGGRPPLRLSVNLSLAQLSDPALVDWLEASLRAHDLSPHRLELELTETALLHDLEHGIEIMRRLKALGVGLVIDDFGTGHSSLSYLKRFPVEKLKIDRSFVIGVASDRDSAAICRAVIGMGRSLGLLLVAEGVENDADLSFVRDQGFDFAQGYHYAAAMPAWELRDWLLRRWVS